MLKILSGVFLFSWFFIDQGTALSNVECYVCSTMDNESDCRYPERYQAMLKRCDQTALDRTRLLAKEIDSEYDRAFAVDLAAMDSNSRVDLNCLKVVTKVGSREHIIRGCQLAEHSTTDICHKIDKENDGYLLQVVHCSRCSTDRCNSAPENIQQFKMVSIVGAIFLIFML